MAQSRARQSDEEVNIIIGVSHDRPHLMESTALGMLSTTAMEIGRARGRLSAISSGRRVVELRVETRGLRAARLRSLEVVQANQKIKNGHYIVLDVSYAP